MRTIMRTISKSLALILSTLLLFACTDGGAGIFYSIEIEEPISNNDLPDFLTSQSAVQIGSDYYFGALQLYSGTTAQITAGSDLSKVALPDGWRYAMQIATDGTTNLYAILENREGDSAAFYEYDGTNWTNYALPQGRPYKVWYKNGTIYVATVTTEDEENKRYSYRLFAGDPLDFPIPGTFTQVQFLAPFDTANATTNPIVDVEHNGANLFVITPADCFQDDGSGTNLTSIVNGVTDNLFKRSLHYTGAIDDTLFMATSSEALNGTGAVYEWDGLAWVVFDSSVGTDPNDFGEVNDGTNDYVLLGTQSGYQEMPLGGTGFTSETSATIDTNNYENKELESAAVMGFLDGPSGTFFALTATNGIWKNSGGSWDLE